MTRILIVDDDIITCELISFNLERDGYETIQCHNGKDAIKFCTEDAPPDLMILDLMIPGMSGMEICKEVRKFSTIPIIMLTSKDDTFEKVLGLDFGADDYVVKPFDVKELTARINALLRRVNNFNIKESAVGEQDDGKIIYDNLVIDKDCYEVKIDGKVLKMPPKEFELLYHLASNPNKVYTRDQLLDDVWGFEYYGDSRTVDVHIKRIRTKLDGAAQKCNLKTVWGVGYKFILDDD